MCVYVCSMNESVRDSSCTAHASASNIAGVVQFGSNVSRLKSRFLQHVSDVVDPAPPPVCAPGHGRRPESRPVRQVSLPSTSDNCLLDMSDHVEKFRHTRALFAQLAEQNSRFSPPIPRSFRATSSASPPPSRSAGHVDQAARRSVSPSSSRSSEGQTKSCNGSVTTWSQLESRSCQQNPTSVVLSSRSHTFSQSLDEGSRSSASSRTSGLDLSSRSSAETSRSQVGSRAFVSDVTSRSLAESSRSWHMEGSEVVLRRANRPSLDLCSGRGVLLPRRRSREDGGAKSLLVSKDVLEASLCEADEYWRRQQVDELSSAGLVADCGADTLMSESTFSSGSGEEMARSESGHDLAAALKDTTVSPTADSAEMWSRRLSAALDAKNSELDSSCNGVPADDTVAPRSVRGHGDLENATGGRASDCETTPVCSAADYSQHVTLHNGSSTVVPSRSSDGSRSLPTSVGGSSTLLEIVTGSVTDYSRHVIPVSDTGSNISFPVNLSRSFDSSRSCPPQYVLARGSSPVSETVQDNVSDLIETDIDKAVLSTVNDISRSFSGRCDVERGSETDCETLEGSVADCECKDVDTEKWLMVEESTNCELVTCSIGSSISSHSATTTTATATNTTVAAVDDDIGPQPSDTEDKLTCNSDIHFRASQLHDDGDTCLSKLETDTAMMCGSNLGRCEELQEVSDTTCVSSNEQSHVCSNLSTKMTCLSAGLYLEKTDNSDTILISSSAQRHGSDDGTVSKIANDTNDALAMSISEDEESSGDTDYVVLGQPVSKQQTAAVKQPVKQSNVT